VVNNQLLAQTVVPGMKEAGYGRIVNIVSTSVREPIAGLGVSNTVRAAVAGWAKTLAGELARFGITVNNVLPGFTKTSRLDALIAGRAKAAGRTTDDITRDMLAQVPAGRFAEPWEIAAAIGFLASPAGGYITGVSLPVDGGRIASL
jgi:3-oxoacyl-[acyl-carrier protein] reductase